MNAYSQLLNLIKPNDPRMKEILNAINKCGGDPKRAFYELAKEKGINPNEVLNMLK